MSHEVQLTFVLSAAEAARLLSLLDSVPEDATDDGAVTGTTGEAAKRGRGRPRKVEVTATPAAAAPVATPAAPAPTVDYQKMRADLVPQMMAASKTDEGKAKLLALLQKHGGANKLSSVTNERLGEFKAAFDAAFAAPAASDDMFA